MPTEPEPDSPAREWLWGWALVVLANLPVPLFFGFSVVSASGVIGMLAGIATVWAVGRFVVARLPEARGVFVGGGGLFALSQIVPVAQFWAGSAALELCAARHSLPAGTAFLVTVLTGAQLVTASVMCGLLVRLGGALVRLLGGRQAGPPA